MRHIWLNCFRALTIAAVTLFTGCGDGTQEKLLFPSDAEYSKWIGRPVAPLKLSTIDGAEVDIESLKGRVVLLDFWATWCGPCMQKLPEVKSVYTELHSRGFEIIGVSADNDVEALRSVTLQQGIAWPQHFAGNDKAALRRFGIQHYPSMWLVDQNGVVRYISAGADLKGKVLKLLDDAPTAPFAKDQPTPQKAPEAFAHLKLLGVTSGHALINAGGQSLNFARGEARMVKTSEGLVRLKCVALGPASASFLVDDFPEPVELRPASSVPPPAGQSR